MSTIDEFRSRTRETWAAGDWDGFAKYVAPVGAVALERGLIGPGMRLLDVGTGSGGNVAIPAALAGARVVGADLTPEMFPHARRRAAEAGVEVEWVEADAQEMPFADASFDRVISTFGAMFAPDHARAAAELVRVCAPDGRIVMTTWVNDGFIGEMFKLTGSFMPPAPPGVEPPPLWGVPEQSRRLSRRPGSQARDRERDRHVRVPVGRGGRRALRRRLRSLRRGAHGARAAAALGRVPRRIRRSRAPVQPGVRRKRSDPVEVLRDHGRPVATRSERSTILAAHEVAAARDGGVLGGRGPVRSTGA